MRFHNFWCISFLSSEFLYHVQKTPKSWEKICSITIFHQDPEKTLLQAWKPLKIAFFLPTSFPDHHGQKSWNTSAFLGDFQFTQVQPLSSPHKQCWTRVSRIFFRVSTLYRVGGGRTARKFRKGCTVLRGNREMTEKYEYCSTVPRTFVQDCSNEIRAGAGREKQYGRITFPPKKKRIYCHSLEYCSPITMPL